MLQAHAVRLSLGVFALSAILLSYPARAELEVMSSTVAGLQAGTSCPTTPRSTSARAKCCA